MGEVISFYRHNVWEQMSPEEVARVTTFIRLCGDELPHSLHVWRWKQLSQLQQLQREFESRSD